MIKQYFIQAINLLKENKLISIIAIVGTALAISMIMVIVLSLRVETANFSPENNRDRTLYVKTMSMYWKGDRNYNSNGSLSEKTAKECFKALTTPEVVSIIAYRDKMLASSPEGENINIDVLQIDADFWKIYDFSFVSGKPFEESDFQSGLSKAVVSESVARKLFESTDVVGREVNLDYAPYTIAGVVKDVSELATTAYSEVWIPYTSTDILKYSWNAEIMGPMQAIILARSSSDFPAIRQESEKLRKKYNEQLPDGHEVFYRNQPDTQFVYNNRYAANITPNMRVIVGQLIVIIVMLLLIPAINLSGMTLSRMRKRFPEIGVRKTFGATKSELLWQILTENFLISLIGGVLGLLITFAAAFVLKDMLFDNATLSISMILDPVIFIMAFLFCLLLNLLSAGIPAWRAARMNIVTALNA